MVDTEKALEFLALQHPILVFLKDGIVSEVLTPTQSTTDNPYFVIDIDNDLWYEDDAEIFASVAIEDMGYIATDIIAFAAAYDFVKPWDISKD